MCHSDGDLNNGEDVHTGETVLGFLGARPIKSLPAMQETWVPSLGWEDPPEKGITTNSSILAWRIPWTEEPGGLQSMGLEEWGRVCWRGKGDKVYGKSLYVPLSVAVNLKLPLEKTVLQSKIITAAMTS